MSENIHKNIHLTFKKAVKLRAKEHVRSVFFFYAQENLVKYCIIVCPHLQKLPIQEIILKTLNETSEIVFRTN